MTVTETETATETATETETETATVSGSALDEIRALNARVENEPVQAFRRQGRPVVGYACTFTPVELIEAAGALPFRLRALGNPQTDRADARLSRFNCRFCRACLQLGLDGTYDFLHGLIETNGCDQLRGMFENWQYAGALPFFHYLKAPHVITPESLDHFTLELWRLREALEDALGTRIEDDALREAMARQQRIRDRLAEVLRYREQPAPALTGSEALQVALAQGAIGAAGYEALLDRLLSQLAERAVEPGRARLLIGGAASDEPGLLAAMEDLGALVVSDTLCFGTRAFLPQRGVFHALAQEPAGRQEPADPVRALAERYLLGSRCPRMYDAFGDRYDFLREAMSRSDAQGVILVNNKFCDLHGFDNAMLARRLREDGLPVLSLEKDYGSQADQGRLRTRVQAFLEQLGGQQPLEPMGGAA